MKKIKSKDTTDIEYYYYNDIKQLHNENGPAIEYVGGGGLYFLNGEHISGYSINGRYITDVEVFNQKVLELKLERLKQL